MNSNSKLWSVSGLALLLVVLVSLIALSQQLFKGMRVDLTDNNLYTMTDGTKKILASIDEPINLYFYFSETNSEQLGVIRTYAQRVKETLQEYELRSKGKIKLHLIDPLPFSEAEDEAARSGLQAVPINTAGDSVYFGLLGTNSLDDQATIPFFQTNKETFLEYDLSKLIHSLAHPQKTTVGLMTTLPMQGGIDPRSGRSVEPWVITTQIGQIFDIQAVPLNATEISAQIDVLMLVHPKEISEDAEFAIEQFLLRGGKAIVFVDPFADIDRPIPDPDDPASLFQSRSSGLNRLFAHWGLNYDPAQFVADQTQALSVRKSDGMGQTLHLGIIGVTNDHANADDVVSADLESVNFAFPGSLSMAEDASITMEALLNSSSVSGLMEAQSLLFSQEPEELQNSFAADAQQHIIAARVGGDVTSAFANRSDQEGFIAEGPINAIIVADVDLLADPFWVSVQNFFGRTISDAFASNGDFVYNSIDNLTGSSDLIGIRGRETFRRPFKVVDDLKVKADEEFRQTERRLQEELAATEQRLGELQTSRQDQGSVLMTPEQQAEINNYLEQKVRIRKDLREVRRNLDKDIKSLGVRLKAINAAAVPLILVCFALYSGWRRKRRRS